MLVHESDLQFAGSPSGEPFTNDHRRRDRALATSSTPARRSPEHERLQHRKISEWIVREYFWMNGNAAAWRRWLRNALPDVATSMLGDREARKPLEWDIRTGVNLRKAREHGLPAPVSEVIVPLLAAASDGPG